MPQPRPAGAQAWAASSSGSGGSEDPVGVDLTRVTTMSMRWGSLVTDTPDRRDADGTDAAELGRAFASARAELGVRQDFPPGVLSEAQAMATQPALPSRDETTLPFLTIDRPGGRRR